MKTTYLAVARKLWRFSDSSLTFTMAETLHKVNSWHISSSFFCFFLFCFTFLHGFFQERKEHFFHVGRWCYCPPLLVSQIPKNICKSLYFAQVFDTVNEHFTKICPSFPVYHTGKGLYQGTHPFPTSDATYLTPYTSPIFQRLQYLEHALMPSMFLAFIIF